MPDEYDWYYWVQQVLEEVIGSWRKIFVLHFFESDGATLRVVTVGDVRRRLLQQSSQQFS